MNIELQESLYEKYPKIFRQKDLSITQTCMGWGIETPDTWYGILDKLCEQIQNHVNQTGIEPIECSQCKEKFGSLRFYTNGFDEVIMKYIEEAEIATRQICAWCGSKENIKASNGWITYLCDNCRKSKVGG